MSVEAADSKPTIPAGPRATGTVKWFSNLKCFGFLTPTGASEEEDVFVHQSNIHSEGFRTLKEGMVVEYTLGNDEDGRPKAEHITAVGGGYIEVPARREHNGGRVSSGGDSGGARRTRRGRKAAGENKGAAEDQREAAPAEAEEKEESAAGGGGRKNRQRRHGRGAGHNGSPPLSSSRQASYWHYQLSDAVKDALVAKNVPLKFSSMDIAVGGKARIKLGNEGYAACVNVNGTIAEGKFESDADGNVTLTWNRCIALNQETKTWEVCDIASVAADVVPLQVLLVADTVTSVQVGDEVAKVWKDDETVPDPKEVLEANGFAMRRVFWAPPGQGRRPGRGGRGRGGAAGGNKSN